MGVLHVNAQHDRANISVAIKGFQHGATIPRDKNTVNGVVWYLCKKSGRAPFDKLRVRFTFCRIMGDVGIMPDTSPRGD
jgi:hypothetical protein